MSEKDYEEKIISEKPIIRFSGKGWNAKGMHQIDAIKVGKRWIAVVDGKN